MSTAMKKCPGLGEIHVVTDLYLKDERNIEKCVRVDWRSIDAASCSDDLIVEGHILRYLVQPLTTFNRL